MNLPVIRVVASLLVVLIPVSALCAAIPEDDLYYRAPVLGVGTMQCSTWLAPELTDLVHTNGINWINGALSGRNLFKPGGLSLYLDYDLPNFISAIESRCEDNPNNTLAHVVYEFIEALDAPPP